MRGQIGGKSLIPMLQDPVRHRAVRDRQGQGKRFRARGQVLPGLKRRPTDWLGTLISDDGVHPTPGINGANGGSEPTEENLKNSGYLLRGWLSVKKIAEVKSKVLDRKK